MPHRFSERFGRLASVLAFRSWLSCKRRRYACGTCDSVQTERCAPCSLLTCARVQVYPGSLSAPLLLAFVVRQLHRLGLVSDRNRLSRAVAERYSDFLTQVTELGGAHERIVAAVRTLADRDRHEVT